MTVSLTPEFEAIVNERLASGMYHSPSEVVREALCLLRDHDEFRHIRLEALRREIAVGIEASEQGSVTAYDAETLKAMFENIKTEGRARLKTQQETTEHESV